MGDSKLRFEPLKMSSSRVKLTSVLSRRDSRIDPSNSTNNLQEPGGVAGGTILGKFFYGKFVFWSLLLLQDIWIFAGF